MAQKNLLDLVNRVFALAREDPVDAFSAADVRQVHVRDLLNQAKDGILNERDWDFLTRFDGTLEAPAPISGTSMTATQDSADVDLLPQVPTRNWLGVPKLIVDESDTDTATVYPNTAYRVLSFDNDNAAQSSLVLHRGFSDTIASGNTSSWSVVFHEFALPTTVSSVLSIRDEEQPLGLAFEHDTTWLDYLEPRRHTAQSRPDVAIVSGEAVNVFDASGGGVAGDPGIRLLLWPVPSSRTLLFYTYTLRVPDLAAQTDTLSGIPDEVLTFICQKAFQLRLESNVEQDPQRAIVLGRRLDREIARMHARHKPDRLRRRIPQPFGRGSAQGNPWRRWDSQQIQEP